MTRLTLGDRLSSAFVGAVIGLLVGLMVAWLLGVYSNTLGASYLEFSLLGLALKVSGVFALLGLMLGPRVGSVLGEVISAIFAFEAEDPGKDVEVPRWLALLVLGFVVAGVWWILRE